MNIKTIFFTLLVIFLTYITYNKLNLVKGTQNLEEFYNENESLVIQI